MSADYSHMNTFRIQNAVVLGLLLFLPLLLVAQPEPATSKSQVAAREQLEYGMFIHFNMNTYAGAEYDNGRMAAAAFKPNQLDVDQWIRTARDAGMNYAVLTAKHTGGFCLWDSKVTWKGKEYDYREKIVLATGAYNFILSYSSPRKAVEKRLRQFGTGYLDV